MNGVLVTRLQHEANNIYNADRIFIALDQFELKILHL